MVERGQREALGGRGGLRADPIRPLAPARTTLPPDGEVPGYRNYLVFCDESGIGGNDYYGFGSLWMPSERRGDFAALITSLRERHRFWHEIKWSTISRLSEPICTELVQEFFRIRWLMFHCLVVRRAYVDPRHHEDMDEARRKHFAMLVQKKIAFFSRGATDKLYHLRVDPIASRARDAAETAHKVMNATLRRDIGVASVRSLRICDSKETPGIQLCDLLLGATMSHWQADATKTSKLRVASAVAEHLGWSNLRADTYPAEWKFNVWYFFDPPAGEPREARTRHVRLKYPMPALRRRRS